MIFRKKNSSDGRAHQGSITDLIFSPITKVRKWFADALAGDDSIRTEKTTFESILSVITLPLRLLFAIGVFMVQAWSTSRGGRAFILGLPAVGAVGICIVALWASTYYFNALTLGHTRSYYQFHASNKEADPTYALMFAEKLVELTPKDPTALFRLGISHASNDDFPRALALMKMLAPPQETTFSTTSPAQPPTAAAPGENLADRSSADQNPADVVLPDEAELTNYVPAHLWLSAYYQKKIAKEYDPTADELAEKHLLRADAASPNNSQVLISLASLYQQRAQKAKTTDQQQYIAQLKKLEAALSTAVKPPIVNLPQIGQIPKLIRTKRELAKLDSEYDFDPNDEQFNQVLEDIQRVTRKLPENIRLVVVGQIINAKVQLKDYDGAVEVISNSINTFNDEKIKEQLIQQAAIVFLENARNNEDLDDQGQYKARLNSICACLNSNFREIRAHSMLLGMVRHNQFEPDKYPWLQETLLNSPKLIVNHLAIGCHLIYEGDRDDDAAKVQRGLNHWKIAYRIDPQAQSILSNLIELSTLSKSDRLESLALMVEQALKMFPDQGLLHRSAGILMADKRDYEQAIDRLRYAASIESFPLMSHVMLSHCYQKLGDQTGAATHQASVDELFAKLNPNQQAVFRTHVVNLTGTPLPQ